MTRESIAAEVESTIAAERAAQKTLDDNTAAGLLAAKDEALAALQSRFDAVQAAFDAYRVKNPEAPPVVVPPTPVPPTPVPPAGRTTILGLSAPANMWAQRLSEVGSGIGARRIFAWLDTPNDQMDLVDAAFKAGMMPVVSWKVQDVAGAKAGKYDAELARVAAKIASYGKAARVAIWHEPNPDISGADFEALVLRFAPILQKAGLKVGCFINGWLLDKQADTTFAQYATPKVLALLDWAGIDTYESGTMSDPGKSKPADRIPELVEFLSKRGFTKPIGIGEYNGYSAATIKAAGDMILSTPQVEFACMWDNTIGKGYVLTGDRLAAFRGTLADKRVARTA